MENSKSSKGTPKLTSIDLFNIKELERKNLERANQFLKKRNQSRLVGGLLGAGVFGIYFYTMFAVKQEHFLDDFEMPEKSTE